MPAPRDTDAPFTWVHHNGTPCSCQITRTFKFHKPHLLFCEVWAKFNLLEVQGWCNAAFVFKSKERDEIVHFYFYKEKRVEYLDTERWKPRRHGTSRRRRSFSRNGSYVLFKDTYVMSFSSRFWTYRRKYSMPKAFKRPSSLHLPYHLFNLSQVSSILVRSWYFTEERELNILDTGAEKNSIWKLLFLTVTLILHPGRVRVRDLAVGSCYSKRTPAVHTESDLSSS